MPFTSPGAEAGNALVQFLMQRKEEERQRALDELSKKNIESQVADRATARKLQEAQIADLAKQREASRIGNIVETMVPEQEFDPETRKLMTEFGYGGMLKEIPAVEGVVGPEGPQQPKPARYVAARGGTKWQAERQKAEERAAQITTQEEARTERQHLADAMDKEIALLRAQGSAQSQEIANSLGLLRAEMLKTQITGERTKQAESAAKQQAQTEALQESKQQTLDVVNSLLTPEGELTPGLAHITGGSKVVPGVPGVLGGTGLLPGGLAQYVPGSPEADAAASLARVKARMVVDLIADMKQQSKTGATGFGQLSDKERIILEDSAAKLRTAQSDTAIRDELLRIRDLLKKAMLPPIEITVKSIERVSTPSSTPSGVPGVLSVKPIRK